MKQIVFNDDKLTQEQLDKVVNKVRGVIYRGSKEILLVHYAGLYMLPGGRIEEEESDEQALKREILEESGITIQEPLPNPFLEISSYDKNYVDREKGTINRLTKTRFFEIHTSQRIEEKRKKLTDREKEKGHTIKYVNLYTIPDLIKRKDTDNLKGKQFDRELLTVLIEIAKLRKRREEQRE